MVPASAGSPCGAAVIAVAESLAGIPVVISDALPYGTVLLAEGRLFMGRSQTPIYDALRASYERRHGNG